MLAKAHLKSFIPSTKPKEALRFYRDVLGLKLLSEDSFALEFDGYGAPLRVAIVHEFRPQAFTVVGWDVADIVGVIRNLGDKGVVFERYEFFEQDTHGIWTSPGGAKVAWFKDPDGNLLSLTQLP